MPTPPAQTYVIESTASLAGTNWAAGISVIGNGTVRTVTIPGLAPQRFYRLRVE